MIEFLIAGIIIHTNFTTYYHDWYNGRRTSSGQVFYQSKKTVALPRFNGKPYKIHIENFYTHQSSIAIANDGCDCEMDLSKSLTRALNNGKLGNLKVKWWRI